MDDGEYLQTVRRFVRTLIVIAENNGLTVYNDENTTKAESTDLLTLQRSLCALIQLAKANGLNDNEDVNEAKELIRCSVLGCGSAGACDGVGTGRYPCPLREDHSGAGFDQPSGANVSGPT
jgi:hypothetical protein